MTTSMKRIIYVYSGTGTALAAATRVAAALGDCQVKSITNELEKAGGEKILTETDTVGLIFPCYYGGVPAIVQNFIDHLDLKGVEYVFAVIVSGGNISKGLRPLQNQLELKGSRLDYAAAITVSTNYYVGWYYSAVSAKGAKLQQGLAHLDEQTLQIAKDVSVKKSGLKDPRSLLSKLIGALSSKKPAPDTRRLDREYSAGADCTGCGTCSRVCQAHNITIVNGRPEFLHNCQQCMACFQYCPNQALCINGKPLKKQQYHHPDYPDYKMIRFLQGSDNTEPMRG